MLQFLPALLLLILRGPSVLEQAQLHVAPGGEAVYQNLAYRKGLGVLFATSNHQAFSRAVAQLLGRLPLAIEGNGSPQPVQRGCARLRLSPGVNAALRDGAFECERTRDGPRSV